MQSYKVFIENYHIEFIESEKNIKKGSFFFNETAFSKDFFINMISNNINHKIIYIVCVDAFFAFTKFKEQFTLLDAAGGLVYNSLLSKYLFIKRFGFWDLPKGKFEIEDKNFIECALREVSEECGISLSTLEIQHKSPFITHHYYLCKYTKNHILKTTYWFSMKTISEVLNPQVEEQIECCKWFSKAEIENIVLKNTYSTIIDVLKVGFFI